MRISDWSSDVCSSDLLSTMAGPDAYAPLGIRENPAVFTESLARDLKGSRIAWVGDWNGYMATEPGVLELCESSFEVFEQLGRSEERRVGKECVSTCRSWWSPEH